jgi:hypothetical protein
MPETASSTSATNEVPSNTAVAPTSADSSASSDKPTDTAATAVSAVTNVQSEAEVEASTAPAAVPSNGDYGGVAGGTVTVGKLKTEEGTAAGKVSSTADPTDDNNDEDDANDEEEVDEEDNFFTTLEQQSTTTEAAEEHQPDAHDASHAPKLLQDAIHKGMVDVDESEAESEAGRKTSPVKSGAVSDGGGGEEKKEGEEHHIHHRVSVVVCLLSICLICVRDIVVFLDE